MKIIRTAVNCTWFCFFELSSWLKNCNPLPNSFITISRPQLVFPTLNQPQLAKGSHGMTHYHINMSNRLLIKHSAVIWGHVLKTNEPWFAATRLPSSSAPPSPSTALRDADGDWEISLMRSHGEIRSMRRVRKPLTGLEQVLLITHWPLEQPFTAQCTLGVTAPVCKAFNTPVVTSVTWLNKEVYRGSTSYCSLTRINNESKLNVSIKEQQHAGK